ncbi:MAG: OmpA family protein [Bacteroidetes bacterium]|nr:OmpA family protein [Bacteroidota bacterium]
MKSLMLVCLIGFAGLTHLSAQTTFKKVLLIDFDKAELNAQAMAVLEETFSELEGRDFKYIDIVGHTDGDGNIRYNMVLSKHRSEAAMHFLLSSGIPADKMNISFQGESIPVSTNDNEEGKRLNRRVEVMVQLEPILDTDFIIDNPDEIIQFMKGLNNDVQIFTASAENDIILNGNWGTLINIPKNSLVNNKGKIVTGEVEMELQ